MNIYGVMSVKISPKPVVHANRGLLILAAALAFAGEQSSAQISPLPPPVPAQDANSVDLMTGSLVLRQNTISSGELSDEISLRTYTLPANGIPFDPTSIISRKWDYYVTGDCVTNSSTGVRYFVGAKVNFGEEFGDFYLTNGPASPNCEPSVSMTFTPSGSSIGSSLSYDATTALYTYVTKTGDSIQFSSNIRNDFAYMFARNAFITNILRANGAKVNFYYKTGQWGCYEGTNYCMSAARLQSVVDSSGFMLKYGYASVNAEDRWVTSVTALNLAAEYCDPYADSCAATTGKPTATLQYFYQDSYLSQLWVTDPAGSITKYQIAPQSSKRVTSVQFSAPSSHTISYQYNSTNNRVSAVNNNGQIWTYSYVDDPAGQVATTRTVTVTDPLGATKIYSGIPDGYIRWTKDELGQQTSYEYNTALLKPTKVTRPDGSYSVYAWDSRSNLLTVAQYPKPGSGLGVRTFTRDFSTSCTNAKTCNRPNWETDSAGNRTDYTYDPATGLILSATGPAAQAAGVRPQKRFGYGQFQAYFKNGSGSIVASGTPITLLASESECITQASCSGTPDERRTDYGYGPQTVGTPNNLLLQTRKDTGSGTSLLSCFAYDNYGNRISSTQPRAGLAGCP